MKTAVNKDASRRNRRDTEDGARNARPSDLLIVDDEEDIRTLAARRFRRRGFEVHEAAEVKADRFRENLYYRINVMSLT